MLVARPAQVLETTVNDTQKNTRFAPSPTGPFHLGSARTAYFNWLAARATGGCFTLRIDDTDRERCDGLWFTEIIASMLWLGLGWDKCYRQNYRQQQYEQAERLCDNWPARIKRSDGSFLYNFTSVCCDHTDKTTCIIRGVDHEPNLAIQQKLWVIVADDGTPFPEVHHVGLVNDGGKKLSKRDGCKSVLDLRDEGYSAEAILNAILRLGWSPSDPEFDRKHPLIPQDEAIKLFWTAGKMHKRPCSVDWNKLDWYQRQYEKAQ